MSEWAPNVAGRLEEIDRRLREIQAELVPGRVPRETGGSVNPEASEPSPEPDVEPYAPEAPRDAPLEGGIGAGSEPSEPSAAASVDSDESAGRQRGRSGPLAEALQRARSAQVAGRAAPHEPLPEQGPPPAPPEHEPPPARPENEPSASPPEHEPPPAPHAQEPPPAPPEHEPPPAPAPSPPPAEHTASEPPASGPPPPAPLEPQPPPPSPALQALRQAAVRSDPRVDVLSELQSSLLTATRDLLDGFERASFTASERRENRVTISAGPFTGTEAVHAFEQELSRLPGVRGVGVRGYEGSDRAIIEVELEQPEQR